MVLSLREDSDPYLVALETNEIIDFGTKSKLNEAIAFSPMKKSSDKFKEHKAKFEEIPKLSFKTQVVLWRKRSVRIFSTDQRKLGFNIQIFLDREIPKTTMKSKAFMVCVEKIEEDKEKFDTSKKG